MKGVGMNIRSGSHIGLHIDKGSASGTKDYEKLYNKPLINDVELVGNKTSEELGLDSCEWGKITGDIEVQNDLMVEFDKRESQALSVTDIEKILYLG